MTAQNSHASRPDTVDGPVEFALYLLAVKHPFDWTTVKSEPGGSMLAEDQRALAEVKALLASAARKPTHICLDCGAVGHAGGYHDHGDGNAGDTCEIATVLCLLASAGEMADRYEETADELDQAREALKEAEGEIDTMLFAVSALPARSGRVSVGFLAG